MKEKELYQKIIKGALEEGILLWRVADSPLIKQPFDLCGITKDGIGVCIEVKIRPKGSNDGDTPHWSLYESHQKTWLNVYAVYNGYSLAIEFDNETYNCIAYRLVAIDDSITISKYKLNYSKDKITGFVAIL